MMMALNVKIVIYKNALHAKIMLMSVFCVQTLPEEELNVYVIKVILSKDKQNVEVKLI